MWAQFLFLEFLVANALTYRVVMNYVSALKYRYGSYGWSVQVFESSLVKRLLKGVNYTVQSTLGSLYLTSNLRDLPHV